MSAKPGTTSRKRFLAVHFALDVKFAVHPFRYQAPRRPILKPSRAPPAMTIINERAQPVFVRLVCVS